MRIVLWWIALIVAVVGILIFQGMLKIPSLAISSFWIEVIAAALFAVTSFIKPS